MGIFRNMEKIWKLLSFILEAVTYLLLFNYRGKVENCSLVQYKDSIIYKEKPFKRIKLQTIIFIKTIL